MAEGHRFDPGSFTVESGETVTWTNDTDEAHTVTAEEGAPVYFASGGFKDETAAGDDVAGGLIAPGESYGFTFDQPGTYRYYCIPHKGDGMRGTIIVE